MKFRPCIDIHNGRVKQIIGSTLCDAGDAAGENFVSAHDAAYYARLYKDKRLSGGHIIILNQKNSAYYSADLEQARMALAAFPGGMQIGGGVTAENAKDFLDMGASHVIVTSYVFKDGAVNYENLKRLVDTVGKERLVLDLSCRKRGGAYYIVTDRWQNFTDLVFSAQTLEALSGFCAEFLIHAVDAEGKNAGIEAPVAEIMGRFSGVQSTYAGGIASFDDVRRLGALGRDRVDFTIGSALDLFGGKLSFEEAAAFSDCGQLCGEADA
ncbi:MAG: phosphoribosylformimino-5-aminoimidazole carboxamide ribotide isomerase [Oscillospiraceae bacterium]